MRQKRFAGTEGTLDMADQTLLLGHSPDPDDAFMFYGLAAERIETHGWRFEHILQDIQTLNDRALRGELHITAVSIHAYPYVAGRYALTACGSSMGDGYGPMVVARVPMAPARLNGKKIAVPGLTTTAILALKLLLGPDGFEPVVVPFDQILGFVEQGNADAGLIIHEGQLTYERLGLHLVVDLGRWWMQRTGLPLPLGGNVIRRDLGRETCDDLHRIMRASIRYSLDHREEAVAYALRFGRGLDQALADRFVGMYVNEWTLDYGERGREAVRRLLREGAAAGLTPDPGQIEFLG